MILSNKLGLASTTITTSPHGLAHLWLVKRFFDFSKPDSFTANRLFLRLELDPRLYQVTPLSELMTDVLPATLQIPIEFPPPPDIAAERLLDRLIEAVRQTLHPTLRDAAANLETMLSQSSVAAEAGGDVADADAVTQRSDHAAISYPMPVASAAAKMGAASGSAGISSLPAVVELSDAESMRSGEVPLTSFVPASATVNGQTPTCKNQHQLCFLCPEPTKERLCDYCDKQIEMNVHVWHCVHDGCDYDVCTSCFAPPPVKEEITTSQNVLLATPDVSTVPPARSKRPQRKRPAAAQREPPTPPQPSRTLSERGLRPRATPGAAPLVGARGHPPSAYSSMSLTALPASSASSTPARDAADDTAEELSSRRRKKVNEVLLW